jgi:uncharacterized membrane protein
LQAASFLFILLFLVRPASGQAQDDVPVPPLEAGALLTLHPIFVHFATALTIFGFGLDWLGSARRRDLWQQAGRLSFLAGVAAIGLAVVSGWIEQHLPRPASAFDDQIQHLFLYHEYLGYGLLGVFLMLAVVRLRIHTRLPIMFVILALVGLIGLVIQGYLGGEMVYRYGASVRAVQVLSEQLKNSGQKKAPE